MRAQVKRIILLQEPNAALAVHMAAWLPAPPGGTVSPIAAGGEAVPSAKLLEAEGSPQLLFFNQGPHACNVSHIDAGSSWFNAMLCPCSAVPAALAGVLCRGDLLLPIADRVATYCCFQGNVLEPSRYGQSAAAGLRPAYAGRAISRVHRGLQPQVSFHRNRLR